MLRQGLRRCAPVRRAPFPIPAVSQCQARASQVARTQKVAILPPLRNAFHLSRVLSQGGIADAPAREATESASGMEEFMAFGDAVNHGVHPNLIRAITHDMRYTHMSEIQERTLQASLKGKDMVAQAKTGTGKTLAFLLPMLQRMIDEDPRLADRAGARTARPDDIRGIVISPTRELAEQIAVEARNLTRHTGLVVQSAVGGTRKREMLMSIQRRGCHLLVATPGRLNDILQDPSAGVSAPKLDALVLDEADRMLDVGFAPVLHDIRSMLPDIRDRTRQTMLFSATIPPTVIDLAKSMVRRDQFEFVQTIKEDEIPTHERVPQQIAITRGWINLFPTLYEIMDREMANAGKTPGDRPFKAIIYFNSTVLSETAMYLNQALRRQRQQTSSRTPAMFIHGKLTQAQRTHAAENFRTARSAILFSSDVTSRGMDFPNVTHVIQIGLPGSREQYIHRLGRTGRQGKEGKGFLIVPESQAHEAATSLAGLGLKDSADLEAPRTEVTSADDMPPLFKEVTDAFSSLPGPLLSQAYVSLFGGMTAKEVVRGLPSINHWASVGWGREEPPRVRPDFLRKIGLMGTPGFNVADDRGPPRRFGENSKGGPWEGAFDSFDRQFSGPPRGGRPGGRRDGGFRDRGSRDGGFRDRGFRDRDGARNREGFGGRSNRFEGGGFGGRGGAPWSDQL